MLYHNDVRDAGEGHSSLSDTMMAQFYQGLYFLGSLENPLASRPLQPTLYCSVGNCTYETFQSLAVCSDCADISSYITSKIKKNGTYQIDVRSLPNGFNASI
jgi:hypothetical protein